MKIAFWSEDGESGTTSNMLACAAMCSILYPQSEISVQSLRVRKGQKGSKQKAPGKSDFYFLDCGTGFDEKMRRILKKMDLVVVNLNQKEDSFNRFFLEDSHWIPNFLVLVGNYYPYSVYNRAYLERVYRITPECLGVISNNSEFYHAREQAGIRRFIRAEYAGVKNARNQQLLEELEQFTKQIITKTKEHI